MTLLEEELERAEERLKIATEKMEEASVNCDESERYLRLNLSLSLYYVFSSGLFFNGTLFIFFRSN